MATIPFLLGFDRTMPSRKKEPTNAKTSTDLQALREQIDKFDGQILDALNKRASVATKIGEIKNDTGGGVFNAAREEEVLANIMATSKGPL